MDFFDGCEPVGGVVCGAVAGVAVVERDFGVEAGASGFAAGVVLEVVGGDVVEPGDVVVGDVAAAFPGGEIDLGGEVLSGFGGAAIEVGMHVWVGVFVERGEPLFVAFWGVGHGVHAPSFPTWTGL